MEILAVDEYNSDGHLIYSSNFIGAYVKGRTREEALAKFKPEIQQCTGWLLSYAVPIRYRIPSAS